MCINIKKTFNVNKNITRAEFVAVLIRALGIDETLHPYRNYYKDINTADWYCRFVQAGLDNLLIDRNMAGEIFFPDIPILIEEVVSLLVNAYNRNATKKKVSALSVNLGDVDNSSKWAKEYINIAVELGLIGGKNNCKFAPKDEITHEEATVFIEKFLQVMDKTDTSVPITYNYERTMNTFWEGNIMYDEHILPISKNGSTPEATLLYPPLKILSVKNAGMNIEYKQGRDWKFENEKLIFPLETTTVHITKIEEINLSTAYENWTFNNIDGKHTVLFQEGRFFYDRQLVVTYEHRGKWKGKTPKFIGEKLPKTMEKLKKGNSLKITLFGDSICAGASATSSFEAAPKTPPFIELFCEALEKKYNSSIELNNISVPGKTSGWGIENVAEILSYDKFDLVILGFGMNDGSGNISVEKFKENIIKLMDFFKAKNSDAEFILISTTLANPETVLAGTQAILIDALNQLETIGVVVNDMTSIHFELLKHKTFLDMTGNNVNHPNDFLTRWYAQTLTALLCEPYRSNVNEK